MNAAKDDHLGIGSGRLARKAERVAHEVGDVLDLGALIVVRQQNGVPLPGQATNVGLKRGDCGRREIGVFDDGQRQGHQTASDVRTLGG